MSKGNILIVALLPLAAFGFPQRENQMLEIDAHRGQEIIDAGYARKATGEEKELHAAKQKQRAEQKPEVNADYAKASEKNDRLKAELEKANAATEAANAEIDGLKADLETANAATEAANAEITSLKADLETANDEIERLKVELEAAPKADAPKK
ncbi:MAG: hypothetical protein EOO51_12615 [Flavobacterium sp.]|nr:MAG: hypothetical protein EOO51_12615 [Flavobacterium sp.]